MNTTDTLTEIDPMFERFEAAFNERAKKLAAIIAAAPAESRCSFGHISKLDSELTEMHGDPRYKCETCAEAMRQQKRVDRLLKVGIPQDAITATLDNFATDRPGVNPVFNTPRQMLEAAQRFLAGEIRNAIFAGTPGIGKGHLAAAIAIVRADSGHDLAWVECSKLFRHYHASYKDNSTESIIRWLAEADLLVIDEICLRELPADGEEILFSILDPRHKARRQTILLSNKTADDVRKWLGGRIVDRLRSGGVAFCYGEWDSMRGNDADGAGGEF